MNQKRGEWSHSLIEWQVHRDDQSLLPLLVHSFIACGRTRRPHAPACEKWCWKTLCPGVDTHTGRRIRRFFQKPVAGVVVVSFLDIEPHELSRSSFRAGGWKCVFANGVKS